MARTRFVTPETHRLTISDGEWLLVKKRLTAGEARRAFGRQVKRMAVNETTEIDPNQVGLSMMVEYLIDWSLLDPAGKPVVIRNTTPAERGAILEGLDPDTFAEIWSALTAHEAAMEAEREQEKNASAGETASSATSTSVD
jgi:hypothetical protein